MPCTCRHTAPTLVLVAAQRPAQLHQLLGGHALQTDALCVQEPASGRGSGRRAGTTSAARCLGGSAAPRMHAQDSAAKGACAVCRQAAGCVAYSQPVCRPTEGQPVGHGRRSRHSGLTGGSAASSPHRHPSHLQEQCWRSSLPVTRQAPARQHSAGACSSACMLSIPVRPAPDPKASCKTE